jgi:hypothetical protein
LGAELKAFAKFLLKGTSISSSPMDISTEFVGVTITSSRNSIDYESSTPSASLGPPSDSKSIAGCII